MPAVRVIKVSQIGKTAKNVSMLVNQCGCVQVCQFHA
jgi:hypothetical protein